MNDNSISSLKGIGKKRADLFAKMGINTVSDLLMYYPRRYEDRREIKNICDVTPGDACTVKAFVISTPTLTRLNGSRTMVRFRISDSTDRASVTFFNMPFIRDSIKNGEEYLFYGKFEENQKSIVNPIYDSITYPKGNVGRIVPIYGLTAGITQNSISNAVSSAMDEMDKYVVSYLPDDIEKKYSFIPLVDAYKNIHFPEDFAVLAKARERLIFEELFILACAFGMMRNETAKSVGIAINNVGTEEFYRSLPFSPTNAQKKAVEDCLSDMSEGYCMNRLLQGDVGSGKTLVAAAVMYSVCKNGYGCAMMAPTEILAEQHYKSLQAFFEVFNLKIAKLTGSMTAKEKRITKERLENGDYDIVVGTHALFSDDVTYDNLALVVTDEQHRFGVRQRSNLISKGGKPHVLVMSATPIPRTLSLIIYGDLDVSVLNEMPAGRQAIDTFVVGERYRKRLNAFIEKNVNEGSQVFIVCPRIEDNPDGQMNDLKSAEEYAINLSKELSNIRISCIHGKMKPDEKDAVMSSFVNGNIDVLVSTTVIEVGVDVPNATLMIVENAERFGLSQLHQLRGRVGRGSKKSYCILVSDTKNADTAERLKIMTNTSDGFKIAEEDLKIRGPGDFFGERQHGLPEMHIADLGTDFDMLKSAQEEANLLLAKDPKLLRPENFPLRRKIEKLFETSGNNMN